MTDEQVLDPSAATPEFDTRMSDAEGLMWRLEKDPYLSSTVGNVTILDRAPDFERLVRRMEVATALVPRLRQRVHVAPANVSPPVWVDDSNFDIRFHVRHIALPKPGTTRQLFDLASLLIHDSFDRTRPLWQFTVVDGLRGGRSALIQKLHHTIADGEGLIQVSLAFLDFDRDAPEIPMPDVPSPSAVNPPRTGTGQELLKGLVNNSLRMPRGIARHLKGLLTDPTQIPSAGSSAAEAVRGVVT
ncbi:MAG TPA: wax ester/triacylglycerol synthase family O-acyltransferase, partial [Ilumatobacteraceae bacterium]|nr:wax ester/triacylglycerol synthase family O-acyltransferase [Ilumatobacteraceae bacterium]